MNMRGKNSVIVLLSPVAPITTNVISIWLDHSSPFYAASSSSSLSSRAHTSTTKWCDVVAWRYHVDASISQDVLQEPPHQRVLSPPTPH
jgi:hypothetical protein